MNWGEVELDGMDMLQIQSAQLCDSPLYLPSMLNVQNEDENKTADWSNVRLKIRKEDVEVDEWVSENQHLESMSEKMEQEW